MAKLPLRPPDSRERAFSYFEQLMRYMSSFPQVQFITGRMARACMRTALADTGSAPANSRKSHAK